MSFAHLHLHTQYSLLDGAIRVHDLVERCAALDMPAVAMTDHGNLYGAIDFYQSCKKKGVKPIIGCETYVTLQPLHARTRRDNHHLILLAKDATGYRNLCYLSSRAFIDGFYYDPCITRPLLAERHEGLVCLSGCLGGELAQTWKHQGREAARRVAEEHREVFGDDYFLEIQHNGYDEQVDYNAEVDRLGRELGIPLVVTNDCHYLRQSEHDAQNLLMKVQTGKTIEDTGGLHHPRPELWFKDLQALQAQFPEHREALENTLLVAERCNVEIELGRTWLPEFPTPEGQSRESYLCDRAREGLARRFDELARRGRPVDEGPYRERLEYELSVIEQMGFPGYYLVVWDFMRHAREQGIAVGPGRGSGAGSLVAYALRITDLDPIPYGLMFERFLNPERVSMPDFDLDFCAKRRDEVIRYVRDKYGHDNVGQIVTFGTLKARSAVRDVGRALALPFGEVDKLAKLIPEKGVAGAITIREAKALEPRIRDAIDANETYAKLFDVAETLEGLLRQPGVHAAGLVIAGRPLWEHVPVKMGDAGLLVTQYDMTKVGQAGLVKFDFLGLATLTMIGEAVRLINGDKAADDPTFVDMEGLPLDDGQTYALISAGDTAGVFQLESSGFQDAIRKVRPDRFEEIIALVALYRPGPMDQIPSFARRKHGDEPISYAHPRLRPVLEETYGILVYQEQVMRAAQVLAGYTAGAADSLRKAMGKKIAAEIAAQRRPFIEGCVKSGVDEDTAVAVYDQIEKFGDYGFNKSHAAAYGLLSYQTAWLKTHHPVEFWAALLTSVSANTEKVVKYIYEARRSGVEVLPPDVGESFTDFSVVDGRVRFGLGAVKGVGASAVGAILHARNDGPFTSIFDFCERVDKQKVNRKVIEALVQCGAFDSLGVGRARTFAAIDRAMEIAQRADANRNQCDLFSMAAETPGGGATDPTVVREHPDVPEWSDRERLKLERKCLGFFVSGHPLDGYRSELARYATHDIDRLLTDTVQGDVTFGAVVSSKRERIGKQGGRTAFVVVEDLSGQIEVIVFPKVYEEVRDLLDDEDPEPIVIEGYASAEGEGDNTVRKVKAKTVRLLAEIRQDKTAKVCFHLAPAASGARHSPDTVLRLRQLLKDHPGRCEAWAIVHLPPAPAGTRDGGAAGPGADVLLRLDDRWRCSSAEDLVAQAESLLSGQGRAPVDLR